MGPKLRAVLLALVLALVAVSPALAGNGGIAPVAPQSPNAGSISDTYWLILAVTGAIFVIVEGWLIVSIARFRRARRNRTEEGPQIRGNTNLEIAWTVVPVLIVAAIVGFVFAKLPSVSDVPEAKAGSSLAITVEGHQYYWLFRYPGGQVAVDTMVVPVQRVVTLTVLADDVVHSWWIPALGGKIDAIPGRTNHTWFRAESSGIYRGQCAELCGIQHTAMKAAVEAVSPGQYERFLAAHRPGSSTVGEETFVGVCAKCHGDKGQGDIGPPLQNRRFETQDMTDLLRNGRGKMPAVGSGWTQAQINAVVTYLRRTRGGAQSGG